MKKRYLARNIVWNKHYINVLGIDKNVSVDHFLIQKAKDFLEELRKDERNQYTVFTVERGKRQNLSSFHFQGYSEFSRLIDANYWQKEFGITDTQARKGTQQEAINYVKKERSKLLQDIFEFGIPKKIGRELLKYNIKDADIRKDIDSQRILLNLRLKENYYAKFEDVEKDLPLLFLKFEKWCKNLWDRYHPIKKIHSIPARTIWIYGPSGVGKTTWTKKYLDDNNYNDSEVTWKKASTDKRPRLWFDLVDENCSVLWIEEIRTNFPDYNDLIQIIDKGTRLEIKGSHINNNFDLIILNSLFKPEFVFQYLSASGHKIEILRRIYKGRESKVYELVFDENNFNKLIDRTLELPDVLFKHLNNQEELD